jgi:hypothetical protein
MDRKYAIDDLRPDTLPFRFGIGSREANKIVNDFEGSLWNFFW